MLKRVVVRHDEQLERCQHKTWSYTAKRARSVMAWRARGSVASTRRESQRGAREASWLGARRASRWGAREAWEAHEEQDALLARDKRKGQHLNSGKTNRKPLNTLSRRQTLCIVPEAGDEGESLYLLTGRFESWKVHESIQLLLQTQQNLTRWRSHSLGRRAEPERRKGARDVYFLPQGKKL